MKKLLALLRGPAAPRGQADSSARPASGRLNRRGPAPRALEQRFMFDGAAVGEAAQVLQAAAAEPGHAAPERAAGGAWAAEPVVHAAALAAPTRAFVALPAEASPTLTSARQEAERMLTEFLQRPDALEQLRHVFNTGEHKGSAEWDEAAGSFLEAWRNGDVSLRAELRSDVELRGSLASFTASGPEGKPVIYLNADWLRDGAESPEIALVLLEEFGHGIDSRLNGAVDTAGDEGELFAARVGGLGGTRLDPTEDDHARLLLDGTEVLVEQAAYRFVNAYQVNTATTPAGKESNKHDLIWSATPVPVTISDSSAGQAFSGNDVSATALNIAGVDYFGWISRPVKVNGVVQGFYFWTDAQFTSLAVAQADGNTDGDGNEADNAGFILVVRQDYFDSLGFKPGEPTLKTVGSSSDRVDAALNAVLPPNEAPVAVNDMQAVLEGGAAITGNLLANDTDGNGDPLAVTQFVVGGTTYTLAAGTSTTVALASGSLTVASNGAYSFTPAPNYAGPVPAVTYTVSDSYASSTGTLSLNVIAVNDAPAGTDKTITFNEGSTYTFNAGDFGFTDPVDTPANSLAGVRITTLPTQGSLTLNGVAVSAGQTIAVADISKLRYSASPNGSGPAYASFSFQVQDDGGVANGGLDLDQTPNTITFSVGNVNSAPSAAVDVQIAVEAGGVANGTPGTNPSGNVLTNDTDPDAADGKTVASASGTGAATIVGAGTTVPGLYGTLTISSNGSYSYALNNANPSVQALRVTANTLTDSFTYTMRDTGGLTSTSTLTLTIQGANDAPVAVNDFNAVAGTATQLPGRPVSGNVLANDTDVDAGDTKTVTPFSTSTTGSTTSTGTFSTITLASVAGITAAAGGNKGDAVFQLVNGVYVDTGARVDAINTLNNTIVLKTTGGSTKTITVVHNETLKFYSTANSGTPLDPLQSEAVSTVVLPPATASTSVSVSSVSGISIGATVTGAGVPPGTTVTAFDATLRTVTLSQAVLLNTVGLTFTANPGGTIAGTYGSVVINSDGGYTYTPYTGLVAGTYSDTFNYTMQDASATTSSAALRISVQVLDFSPTAVADTATATETGVFAGTTGSGNVLSNDNNTGSSGTLSVSTYWSELTTTESAPITTAPGLAGRYGSLTMTSTGAYVYTIDNANPAVNALRTSADTLTDTYYYRVAASGGGSAISTLTITIRGANDAPVAVVDSATATEAGGTSNAVPGHDPQGNVLTNDTDVDAGDGKAVSAISGGTVGVATAGLYGSLTLNVNGSYTYLVNNADAAVQALAAGSTLTDTFTYTVADSAGASSSTTLTMTIVGANDAPVNTVPATSPSVAEGASTTIGGVSVADVDHASVSTQVSVASGTVSIGVLNGATISAGANGSSSLTLSGTTLQINAALVTLSYQGAAGYSGIDTLTLTTTDPSGLQDVDTRDITVTPDNRPLTVNSSTVNEGSPFAVFTVGGAVGQRVTLALGAGTATSGLDYLQALEYYNGSAWVSYNGSPVTLASTTLLVRTAILNDQASEGAETFTLVATNRALTSTAGTATIVDNGTGVAFSGAVSGGAPVTVVAADDDRPLSVSSVEVNEKSPYAVFSVAGVNGQMVTLGLSNGTASDADHGVALEYLVGTTWMAYTGPVAIAGTTLLVRTTITDDGVSEGRESFGLTATNGGGGTAVGTAGIRDDGSGSVFAGGNTSGAPDAPGATGYPASLDDDRSVAISSPVVNEGSDFVVFTVTGDPGVSVTLLLVEGPAGAGRADITETQTLQYWDGQAWADYDGTFLPAIPHTGRLLVRVAIQAEQDSIFEGSETFGLSATLAPANGRAPIVGTATIVDDGTGVLYPDVAANPDGTAVTSTSRLDNDNPQGTDRTVTTPEDVPYTFTAADFGFVDSDGDTLDAVRTDSLPAPGTLRLAGVAVTAGQVIPAGSVGQLTFTPLANANGAVYASFTFSVRDSSGAFDSSPNTITVSVTPVDDASVLTADTQTVAEDTPATGNVLANDTDVDNTLAVGSFTVAGSATVHAAGQTATIAGIGTLTIAANGAYTFTPAVDYNGPIPVATYVTNTGSTSTLTITLTAVNDPPTAANDAITVAEDSSASVVSVLANDSFAPDVGETLTVISVTQPATGGTVTLAGGVVSFTPAPNFFGPTSFTYTVSDGNGGTATATVNVTVSVVDDPSVLTADSQTASEDTSATGNVLANDTDVDDTLTVASFTVAGSSTVHAAGSTAAAAGVGTLTIAANGAYTFTPAADYNGAVPVATYTTNTGSSSTLTITLTPVNDSPTATDDMLSVAEDTGATIADVLANDSFGPDLGESLAVTSVTQPATGGAVTLTGGVVSFTPTPNFFGTTSFTYTVSDGNGGTATATVNVTVSPANDNPTAADDTLAVAEDSGAAVINVLGNDSFEPDVGETLMVTAVTQPTTGGTVTLAGGIVSFTPAANFFGNTSFAYTVSDGNGGTATGTVNVTVGPVNDDPGAVDDTITVTANTGASVVNVLANDSFAPDVGETLTVTAVTQPATGGSVALAGGAVSFTPTVGFVGATSFTYTVSDGNGGTATATVNVTVSAAPNNPPTATNDAVSISEDSGATAIDVLANDSFAPDVGETLTVTAVTQPVTGGTVTMAGGVVSFTPSPDFHGVTSFTYTVSDGNGGTATATVNVTVSPVNDNPAAGDDAITVAEDSGATAINVLANDSFAPDAGETLTVTSVTQPATGGTVTVVGGVVSFTPTPNFFGPTSFTYRVSDGNGGTATATVSVTVTPIDDPSVLAADSHTIAEDTAATGNVLANDSDVDNVLTVASFTAAGSDTVHAAGQTAMIGGVGSLTIAADGAYTFNPVADYNGPVPVATYTTNAGSTSTLTITLTPTDDPSVLVADTQTVAEDTPATGNVLANDSDVDNALTVTSFTVAGSAAVHAAGQTATISGVGALTIATDGAYTFTPAADYNGPVPVATYTTNTGSTSTLTITLTPVNDPPTATNDAVTIAEDSGATIINVLANDSFAPDLGETLTVMAVTQPATGGTVTLVDGIVSFTPAPDFHGVTSFTYTVSDGNGGTASATVNVTVTPVNDPPAATNDSVTVAEDSGATVVDVLTNDSFAPDMGETLTVTGVTQPAVGGTATLSGGAVSFTPAPDFFGVTSFTYTVSDGNGGSATATVNVTVTPVDDPSVLVADTQTVAEDTPATGNVLPNDTDVDNTLTVTSFTVAGAATVHAAGQSATIAGVGTLTIAANGAYTFTPVDDYNGPVPVATYTTNTGSTSTLTITLTPVDDPSVAVADAQTVAEDTLATGNVLANDTDVDNTLTVTSFTVAGSDAVHAAGQTATTAGVGALTIAANGAYTFTPAGDYSGPVPVATYITSTGSTSTLTITLTPVNDPPTAMNDAMTVVEDSGATIINVLTNDGFAPDLGETLTVTAVTQPAAGGTVTLSEGFISFTPTADFSGATSFTYTVSDGNGGTATAAVNVTVTPVNDNPTAANDSVTVTEDSGATVVDVLANDSVTPDLGETLTVTAVTQPAAGGAVTLSGGVVSFTPAPDFFGAASFTYTLSDGNGGTATATVNVTVTPVNDNPSAADDVVTVTANTGSTVVNVLANDGFAPDTGENLAVTAVTQPALGGSVTLAAGVVSFTPALGFVGATSFTYTVSDGNGGSATATVNVNVSAVPNNPPVANNDAVSVAEDSGSVTVDVLANDSFAPDVSETLTVTAVTQPATGGAVTLAGGVVSFTPTADFSGATSFTYTVSDGNGGTAIGTVNVTVTPFNDPPTATNDPVTVVEDSGATVVDVLTNDSFAPDTGETLTVTAVTQPVTGGTVALVGGTVSFTPAPDFFGATSFTYTVSDGNGGTATGTVNVTVTPVNDNPTALNDTVTVTANTGATAVNVLANDGFAPDSGETLTVTAVTQPATGGSVTLTGGVVNFTPATGFVGTTSFTYTVSDGNGGSATATVNVNVSAAPNNPPTANGDAITVTEDSGATVVDVLANDSFAPDVGETLTVTAVTQPALGGSVSLAGGVVSFTPTPDFFGATSFTYTVSDGNGGTATATVNVTVTPANDNPVAVNDTVTVIANSGANVVNVLANDSFAPDVGETLTVTAVTQPAAGGSVTLVAGVVSFTPTIGFAGATSFTYTVSDGNGGTATAAVNVTVSAAVNHPPTAVNDAVTVAEDSGATVVDVLANDSSAPDVGEALLVTAVTQPAAGGSVTLTGGIVSFTPAPDFHGATSFTYTVSDGNGGSATATVNVTVTSVNDNPTAVDDVVNVAANGGSTVVNVLGNDGTAPDVGETLSVTSVTQPAAGGSVALAGGVVSFTPAAGFVGATSFTYTVSDGNGGTGTATVNVFVTATPNNPPSAANDAVTVAEDSGVTIVDLLANDSFAPDVGETLTIIAVTQPGVGGSVALSGGAVSFTPSPDFFGATSFTYTVTDGNGGTSTATVNVTVTPVNDNPTAVNDAVSLGANGGTAVINVLANDGIAPDAGETLTVIAVTQPSHGVVSLAGGVVSFTPPAGFLGSTSFTYTVSDGNGGTATATATLSVSTPHDLSAPVVLPGQFFSYPENRAPGDLIGIVTAGDNVAVAGFRFANGGLVSSDGFFAINGGTGELSLTQAGAAAAANDFETGPNTFEVSVQAFDGAGNWSAPVNVTLAVANVSEPVVAPPSPPAPAPAPSPAPTPGPAPAPGPAAAPAPGPGPGPDPVPAPPPPAPAPVLGPGVAPPVRGFVMSPPALVPFSPWVPEPLPVPLVTPTPFATPLEITPFTVLTREGMVILPPDRTQENGFQIAVIEDVTPRLLPFNSVSDQFVERQQSTRFSLPFDAFVHTRAEATIILSAKLADGQDLPAWIRFDPQSGTFDVTPPQGTDCEMQIKVTARDTDGREAVTMFRLYIGDEKQSQLPCRVSMSEQIRLAAKRSSPWSDWARGQDIMLQQQRTQMIAHRSKA